MTLKLTIQRFLISRNDRKNYESSFPLFYHSFLRKGQRLSSQVNDLADLEWRPSTFFHRWMRVRHAFYEFSMDGPKPEPKLQKRVSIFSNPGLETPVLPVLLHPPLQAVNSHGPARPRTGTSRAGFHGKFQLAKNFLGFCSVVLFVKGSAVTVSFFSVLFVQFEQVMINLV